MNISFLDWGLVIAYFIFALAIGLYFSRRAGKSMGEYFVSGRSMPWWLAGTSMVATTFAADTPLAVNQFVYEHGIAGNWIWWCAVMNGMLTVFLFARLWRRVGVMTDIEFAEIRYGGRPAAFLRGFRAVYLGLIANCIVMGWVICAMITIVGLSLNVNKWTAVLICLGITVLYSGLSGLWGVMVTDFFQFIIAMTGSISLALFALRDVGWISGLKQGMIAQYGQSQAEAIFSFAPQVGSLWMPVLLFLVYIGVQWWASWYPGAEPGGGGYIAQRMFSAKDERHSLFATLWFNVAHYALRPWPWILVGLVSLVLLPDLERPQEGYVMLMLRCLPRGLIGLMLAAFAAAFMSTISTHLNWGSSYLISDFYKRFIRRDADERHYVLASRLVTLALVVAAGMVGYLMESVKSGWEILLTIGAGTGLVLILRWYWWRVNAWSEISAMIAALAVSLALRFGNIAEKFFAGQPAYAVEMIITVILTTATWLIVTWATSPEKEKTLDEFFEKARPAGPGWKRFRKKAAGKLEVKDNLARSLFDWVAGCVLIYAALFGTGKIILGHYLQGAALLLLAAAAAWVLYLDLSRISKKTESS